MFYRTSFKLLVILVLSTVLFQSCVTMQRESEIINDATPPSNYKQNFVSNTKPYEMKTKQQLLISALDQRQQNNIKFRVHILDTNNNILTGASASEFKKIWCVMTDSIHGKEKPIKNFTVKEYNDQPTAIAIATDHSGSMGDWRAKVVQEAIAKLLKDRTNSEPIALIRYDSKADIEAPLTTSGSELLTKNPVDSLSRYGGMTAISNGIMMGINELSKAPKNFTKAVIVFTDGFDNSSTITKDSVIRIARKENVMICAVDFGTNINPEYMKQFADSTAGIYNHIYSTDEFSKVFDDIYKRLRNYYQVEYKPTDYGYHSVKLKLCLQKDSVVTRTSFDNTPDLGSIGLLNVYFDFDKATLKPESDDAINGVHTLLVAYPNMKIEFRGHTDSLNSTGDKDYNKKLSKKRADAVKQALVKKGIPADRIKTDGFGETMPVGTNENDEGRALNRRTELVILQK